MKSKSKSTPLKDDPDKDIEVDNSFFLGLKNKKVEKQEVDSAFYVVADIKFLHDHFFYNFQQVHRA
jgi:hypothetical protein